MVWPIVNFLNFRFIPLNVRPTFICSAQFLWQTYMSYVGFHDKQQIAATSGLDYQPQSTTMAIDESKSIKTKSSEEDLTQMKS